MKEEAALAEKASQDQRTECQNKSIEKWEDAGNATAAYAMLIFAPHFNRTHDAQMLTGKIHLLVLHIQRCCFSQECQDCVQEAWEALSKS